MSIIRRGRKRGVTQMALKPKEHFHGSDLEKIEAVYGIKKEDIISFSANVNPLAQKLQPPKHPRQLVRLN